MLYSHNHNNTIIKTDAGRLLYKYMYLSLYCKGSKRVTQGLRVRRSWRPNRNFNILTSILMAVNVVSFSFSWCSTGGPGVYSAGCWLSLLHLISNFSGPQTPSEFPRAPSAGCGFPYHISSITLSNCNCNCNWNSNCLDFSLDWVIYNLIAHSIAHSIFEIACLIVIKQK